MSEHHHHRPHEGHASGSSPARQKSRHNWFFYLSGVILFLALLGFILEGAFWRFGTAPTAPPPSATSR